MVGIEDCAGEVFFNNETGRCFNRSEMLKECLDSIGVENEIVTCNVNLCQNTEPDEIFFSSSRGEMGYFYKGEWFSENECLAAHTINKFMLSGEEYYIDATKSPKPYREKNKYWVCFRY